MKGKFLVAGLSLLLGIAAVVLCITVLSGQAQATAADSVTITLWHQEGAGTEPILQQIVAAFETQYPTITVQIVAKGNDQLRDEFISTATAGGGPDLVRGPSDWLGRYAARHLIRPVDADFDLGLFVTEAAAGALWRGQHWAVPDTYGNHLMLLYNKSLLPSPPLNTTEMISVAKSLTGGGKWGLVYGQMEPFYLMPWLTGFGGWVLDDASIPVTPTLNTPAMVNALQFLHDLEFVHHVIPSDCNHSTADALFTAGNAAMLINGDWSLADHRAALGSNLGIARIPLVSRTGLWPQPMTGGKYYSINANTSGEALAASKLFLGYTTSKAAQLLWPHSVPVLPALLEAFSDPAVQTDPILNASADQAAVGRAMPVAEEMRCVWDAMRSPFEGVMRDLVAPSEAASSMQASAAACVDSLHTVDVGLLVGMPSVEEGTYLWMAYQGLQRAVSQLGVVGTVYTMTLGSDYGSRLQSCVDDGNNLCIAAGFDWADATWNAAAANPDTDFAIVDSLWITYPHNLRGIIFAEDEVGYLAGTLAGLMTESRVVGAIGGIDVPPVVRFVEGYRSGAQCANPDVTVLTQYAGTFDDPDLGAQVAQDMIAASADVIFAPAGQTSVGAVLTATQSGVWGIGVDEDFFVSVFGSGAVAGSDRLLSSAMKRVDNAVFSTIGDIVSGTFTSGTITYDLPSGGVGLAPFHAADPFVPQSVRSELERVKQGIISGAVPIYGPCPAPAIRIGVAGPFSGSVAAIGWAEANAVQLAVSQTNAAGGINMGGITHTLVLVAADDRCNPIQAIVAANTLLDGGVVAVVGHTCSDASMAAQSLYSAAGVAMISPSSTNPALTRQGYTNTFRTIPHDGTPATLLATYFRSWLGFSKSAVVESDWYPPGDAYSTTFGALGGTITSRRAVTDPSYFTATLTAIRAEDPDVVFYSDLVNADAATSAGQFSKVACQLGMTHVVIGWNSATNDESVLVTYTNAAGPVAAENDYAVMQGPRFQDMPAWTSFLAAYQAAGFPNGPSDPGVVGAYAYDAAGIIIAAMERAGSADPAAIRDQIAATTNYEGIAGTYQGFDSNGDVIPQWAWLERYENGQWVALNPSRVFLPTVLKKH